MKERQRSSHPQVAHNLSDPLLNLLAAGHLEGLDQIRQRDITHFPK